MLDAFRDHAFRGHTVRLVMVQCDIATDYAAQGMRLTVRLARLCVTPHSPDSQPGSGPGQPKRPLHRPRADRPVSARTTHSPADLCDATAPVEKLR
jgi:hypothetical protein